MQVASGTRLGPYEIVSPLGAGGMGEVWRATDTRLDRSVAIKILPADFAQNAQFKMRFEREARTISQLNHPHICTLFDVGDSYLVMELLEGESLADRIARGPMPISEVMKYGVQIAAALDKAHRAGIVHRDLKPGNVMITKSGAKLLDFGLAKSQASVLGPRSSVLETEHKPLTEEGTILGTFQYMAPEQLEGQEADGRTDIFAFGAVLYEMATGSRAFQGKTKTSLIAAIVQNDPQPISQLQPLTPPAFEHVVSKCLAKDPDDRWQSAHDIAEELRWISEAGSQAGVASPLIARKRTRERLAWVALAIAAIAGAWLIARRTASAPLREVIRFSIPIANGTSVGAMAAAPDGRSIAFVSIDRERKRSLWLQSFRNEEPRRLVDLELVPDLFWSPDSRTIAWLSGTQLKSIAIDSGAPQTICDTHAVQGSWGRAGVIVLDEDGSTYRVSDRGGVPVLSMTSTPGTLGQHSLSFLPDGHHFLFVRTDGNSDPAGVYVASLDGTDARRLFSADRRTRASYAEPGFITYTLGSKLFARAFDARSLTVSGDPLLVLDGIGTTGSGTRVSVSQSGAVVYRTAGNPGAQQVLLVDRKGHEIRTVGKAAPIWHIALSHDERTMALEVLDPAINTTDVWTCNIESGATSRLTSTAKYEWQMTWWPDDSRLIFASNQTDASDIYSIPAGGGNPTIVYKSKLLQAPVDVSPDGKFLLFIDNSGGGQFGQFSISALPLSGATPIPVAAAQFNQQAGRISPDGAWVSFDSDDSGQAEVYVQRFPHAQGRIQISTDGGFCAAWRRDGRELYYVTRSFDLVAVPVDRSGSELRFGKAVPLFRLEWRGRPSFSRYLYAPTRDGVQFYVTKTVVEPIESPIHVILNATSALEESK